MASPDGSPFNLLTSDFPDGVFAMAYNLGNFLRRLALPRSVRHWWLTTLREKLIKIGAKVVTHARYVIFQMAEVAAQCARSSGQMGTNRGETGGLPWNQVARPGRMAD